MRSTTSERIRVVEREDAPPIKPRVAVNDSNSGRLAGNAKWVIARRPWKGYPLKRCTWCHQDIKVGSRFVKQDRWLFWRGRWYEPGPRHDQCWALENDAKAWQSTAR